VHRNAPMTARGRMIMIDRIARGRPVAHAAAEMGVYPRIVVRLTIKRGPVTGRRSTTLRLSFSAPLSHASSR
jgi:hypothetical protein